MVIKCTATVEGTIDYEIMVDDDATQEEIDQEIYEQMPSGWESYCGEEIDREEEEEEN